MKKFFRSIATISKEKFSHKSDTDSFFFLKSEKEKKKNTQRKIKIKVSIKRFPLSDSKLYENPPGLKKKSFPTESV